MSPRQGMRSLILLDLSLVDVSGRPPAVKGLSARPSGVMKRSLFKTPSSLVVGAFPRQRQHVSQFVTESFHSVRENPGGTGHGPVSPPIVTSPKLTRSPALLRSWEWKMQVENMPAMLICE